MKKLMTLIVAMLALLFSVFSQFEGRIGTSKTELRDNAVTVFLSYLQSLDDLFGGKEQFIPGKNSFFKFTPEADINFGTEDAMSSINIRATGYIATFKTAQVEGLYVVDFDKTFHVFPVSIGVEASSLFNTFNAILEAGWYPYYQSYGRPGPKFIKQTNFGLSLQAGYKFYNDTTGNTAEGGQIDESLEPVRNAILRAKGAFSIDSDKLLKIQGFEVGLIGSANVWYDFLNTAIYHQLEGKARIYLSDGRFIDFIYSKGSGAPLFNYADQYGVGFTFKF